MRKRWILLFFVASWAAVWFSVMKCRPSNTGPELIACNNVILLRMGGTNGAFLLTRQSVSPEVIDYTWFLRADGKSTFNTNDSGVSSGRVSNATFVAFGPFKIDWSTAGDDAGYLYYPNRYRRYRMPGGRYISVPILNGTMMAVTDERKIEAVDVHNRKWKFKR